MVSGLWRCMTISALVRPALPDRAFPAPPYPRKSVVFSRSDRALFRKGIYKVNQINHVFGIAYSNRSFFSQTIDSHRLLLAANSTTRHYITAMLHCPEKKEAFSEKSMPDLTGYVAIVTGGMHDCSTNPYTAPY